jgi:hypothetical protein
LVGLAIFLLAVYGLSNAIAVLKIGRYFLGEGYCHEEGCPSPRHPKDLRKGLGRIPYLGDLFYCPPCLAFWLGMGASHFMLSPAAAFVAVPWKGMVADGLAASAAAWIVYTWTEKNALGTKI